MNSRGELPCEKDSELWQTKFKGACKLAQDLINAKQSGSTEPLLERLRGKRNRRHRVSLAAVFLDLVAITVAYVVASLLYVGFIDIELIVRTIASVAPIYFLFGLVVQSYPAVMLLDGYRSSWRAATALVWASLLMFLIFFFLKISEEFSRAVLGIGTLIAVILIGVVRINVAKFASSALGPRPFAYLYLYDEIALPSRGHESSLRIEEIGLEPDRDNPAMLDFLGRLASGLDGVVVSCPQERREQWALMLKSLDVRTEIVAPELSRLRPLAIEEREGSTSLIIGSGQLSLSQRILKRGFDLFVTLSLMPLLLPLLGLVALLVKLDSSGPILFRQERIGLGNRKFNILKFRTMRVEMQDDAARKTTSRRDPRVTRVGGFLRRTSLDELSQFINVLRGDMSIVGPRPHAECTAIGDTLLWEIEASYWHRHVVKPGITGLAQVRGHRGSLFDAAQLKARLDADLEYVTNWSITSDLRIILLTLRVLTHKNAF